ncbi:MAG: preprotein translocase subunit YajC [Salinisphaeraceae bacterium]
MRRWRASFCRDDETIGGCRRLTGRLWHNAALSTPTRLHHRTRNMLDFLISPAYAQGAPAAGPSIMPTLIMVGLFFVFMYFMIIRPQMKRQKEHRQLLESLEKGNEVVTQGGIAGKVRDLGENFIAIEVADGVLIKVQKQSVSSVVPKGTLETL